GIDADRGRRVGKPEGELFDFAASLDRVDASRTLLNMLGMRNYIGQVEVTSDIKQVIPKAASFLRKEIRRIVKRLPPTQQADTERTLVRTIHAIETTSIESYK